jgi:hypothetical protein
VCFEGKKIHATTATSKTGKTIFEIEERAALDCGVFTRRERSTNFSVKDLTKF